LPVVAIAATRAEAWLYLLLYFAVIGSYQRLALGKIGRKPLFSGMTPPQTN
jgi:hypothetical protein